MTDAKEKIVHAQEIVKGVQQRDPFFQFQGASHNNVILITPESAKEGTTTTFKIVSDLVGDGVSGNQDLSENRDELNFVPFSVKGEVIANSIKSPIKKILDRSHAKIWRQESKTALIDWMTRKTVRHKFYALSHDCTNIVYGGGNADVSTMEAGDVFDTTVLDEMIKRAKNGWNDGVSDHPPLNPFTIEKKTEHGIEVIGEYYPVFMGPANLDNLNSDPVFKAEQQAKATAGMFSNLSGFAGVYRNAVLIEVPANSPLKAGAIKSSSADYGKYTDFDEYAAGVDATVTEFSLLLGCGAGAMPFDPNPTYDEDPTEDNKRKVVAYIEQYFGFEKVRWSGETTAEQASIYHDKDYATIAAVCTVE